MTPLNQRRIVTAALSLTRQDGEPPSMRTLAAELEVTPGALYRHLTSQQQLVALMVDDAMERVAMPGPAQEADPWERIRIHVRSLMGILDTYPGLDKLIAQYGDSSPAARLRQRWLVRQLQSAGLARADDRSTCSGSARANERNDPVQRSTSDSIDYSTVCVTSPSARRPITGLRTGRRHAGSRTEPTVVPVLPTLQAQSPAPTPPAVLFGTKYRLGGTGFPRASRRASPIENQSDRGAPRDLSGPPRTASARSLFAGSRHVLSEASVRRRVRFCTIDRWGLCTNFTSNAALSKGLFHR
jgi:AcrR family transcriptional regulator